ncbi:uncharacterized protein LOC119831109 [Zerene cesonia]|uniref:uncharacterized protein LOC119831109 n=1 Tax=Zerene cesonia TaxID=33412 RepID=UPI0018E5412C|nr:uncharacterized protein LOC119831109 [Zerene cesonia]
MLKSFLFIYLVLGSQRCASQMGPDPWDEKDNQINTNEDDLPPDLKLPKKIIKNKAQSNQGMSDWFYKRLLTIILKGGQKKENDDSTIDISLQMKYSQEQLNVLDEYITSGNAISEEMFRRSIAYVEESIYKPSITEKIAMAWSEYIFIYFVEYKEYLTWGFSILACVAGTFWLWQYISYKNILISIAIVLYLYEAFISYKEAEKEEVTRFLSAINACKWYFWTSNCEVTPPDPLVILKHMNPLKIGIRMFTIIITEPMITISATVNTMINGITADLWYPLDKILQVTLLVVFNGLLITLLVCIIFNFILNIPLQLNFFYIMSIVLPKHNRNIGTVNETPVEKPPEGDRISGETLNRFLDLCNKALNTTQANGRHSNDLSITNSGYSSIRRSASTGRLQILPSNVNNNNNAKNNKNPSKNARHNGSGDA